MANIHLSPLSFLTEQAWSINHIYIGSLRDLHLVSGKASDRYEEGHGHDFRVEKETGNNYSKKFELFFSFLVFKSATSRNQAY